MKKIIALFLLVTLCFTVFACGKTNPPDTDKNETTTSTTETTTESTTETSNEPSGRFDDDSGRMKVKIHSDITDVAEVTPYAFLNAAHYYMNDGPVVRGTGRESMFDIKENISMIPRVKVKNGFGITSSENETYDNVTLLDLEGNNIKNGENLPCDNFTSYIPDGTECVARFCITQDVASDNGTIKNYYLCYVIIEVVR